jgi:isoleucyl-tRNA synthetase
VRFPVTDPRRRDFFPEAAGRDVWLVIWTTTPWTLPDNMAVAVHPDYTYVLARWEDEYYLLAEERLDACRAAFGIMDAVIVRRFTGEKLAGLICGHPFYNRSSPVVLGRHVTLDAGTGIVHTAPGHGREDYEIGLEYGLEILSPLDDSGRFLDSVEFFAGKNVFEANPLVIDLLRRRGNLILQDGIRHSYPHCWRCKEPVIFRATTQWFISMEANDLRKRTLDAIGRDVRWIPAWGEERIHSMIENRPDWCISRQRVWGVPIVALLCESCGAAWHDHAWNREMAERFAAHPAGCDYWFEAPLEDIVPAGLSCPECGAGRWRRESDILDVWFDSGTSFAAVVERRPECRFPADMYLEGSDQHRGWFHSSLLASMGTRGAPPYREVLTHGYVVDGEGKKMSKSVGNVIAPDEVISRYGAEILRMWVSSVDYREDIRMSDEILNRLVDAYRRIRNTCRYLLGNLGGFAPEDALPEAALDPLDRYALHMVSRTHAEVGTAYAAYEFHKVFHAVHNLCVTDLSAFYLDVIKDRLYTSAPDGQPRRSAQTALRRILLMLLADMAPVLSFTAEEALSHLDPALRPQVETVFALREEHLAPLTLPDAEIARWQTLLQTRAELTRAVEPLRKAGGIGHSLDTAVTFYAEEELARDLRALGTDLRSLFIVSDFSVKPLAEAPADSLAAQERKDLRISVTKAEGEKCARCWVRSPELGSDPARPDVCPRCAGILRRLDLASGTN